MSAKEVHIATTFVKFYRYIDESCSKCDSIETPRATLTPAYRWKTEAKLMRPVIVKRSLTALMFDFAPCSFPLGKDYGRSQTLPATNCLTGNTDVGEVSVSNAS